MNKFRNCIILILINFSLNTFAGGIGGGGGVRPEPETIQGGTQGGGGVRPYSNELSGGNSGSGGAHPNPLSKVDGGHEL